MANSDDESTIGERALGAIEGDLLKAEAAYADADKRLRSAQLERKPLWKRSMHTKPSLTPLSPN